jgi:hypothetical protein
MLFGEQIDCADHYPKQGDDGKRDEDGPAARTVGISVFVRQWNFREIFVFFHGVYIFMLYISNVDSGRRCRRPLPVAASVEKSEDNALYTLHQRNKSDKRGARTRRCPFAPALIK